MRSVQLGISGYSHDPDSSPTDVSPYHYQQQRTANSGEAYHKNQYIYIYINIHEGYQGYHKNEYQGYQGY